ncbi:hypothetical protein Acr_28g0002430 [Actinidia rufa]|uniref:Uncharacterized protein n=1 Tax=Actinidia rufa TaxID=165716 RepID=A0A7J0H952_9ERIC|nr:hypothetical protein Acr_28g0002430 [Actinidia rufa]
MKLHLATDVTPLPRVEQCHSRINRWCLRGDYGLRGKVTYSLPSLLVEPPWLTNLAVPSVHVPSKLKFCCPSADCAKHTSPLSYFHGNLDWERDLEHSLRMLEKVLIAEEVENARELRGVSYLPIAPKLQPSRSDMCTIGSSELSNLGGGPPCVHKDSILSTAISLSPKGLPLLSLAPLPVIANRLGTYPFGPFSKASIATLSSPNYPQ